MIRLLLALMVIILYLIFVLYNLEERIVLKYAMGLSTLPLPVYLVILASLIIGMLFAVMLTLPGWIHLRVEMRRQRRTLQQMEQELNRLASIPPNGPKSNKTPHTGEPEEM